MFQPAFRGMRALMRCHSLAMLLALSIAIPKLSPRCGFAGDKPTPNTDTQNESKIERPPFDLTYLPSDAMGVIAIRPSVIFSDPAMKPLADMANQGLAQLRQFFKLPREPKLSIEDIEETIGNITIKPDDKKHGLRLMAGLTMIRINHEFDWLKLMRQLDPKTEEVRHGDRVYYRSHFERLLGEISATPPKATFGYFMPDKRTLAFLQEKTLPAFVNGKSVQRPHFSWDADWKRVEHGLIAVAIDNRWAKELSKEQIDCDPEWSSIVQNTAAMVAGASCKDGIDLQAHLRGKDRAACDQIAKDIKAKLGQLRREIAQSPKDVPEDEADALDALWCKQILEHVRIERCETAVRLHTMAKLNLADVVKCLTKEATLQPK